MVISRMGGQLLVVSSATVQFAAIADRSACGIKRGVYEYNKWTGAGRFNVDIKRLCQSQKVRKLWSMLREKGQMGEIVTKLNYCPVDDWGNRFVKGAIQLYAFI